MLLFLLCTVQLFPCCELVFISFLKVTLSLLFSMKNDIRPSKAISIKVTCKDLDYDAGFSKAFQHFASALLLILHHIEEEIISLCLSSPLPIVSNNFKFQRRRLVSISEPYICALQVTIWIRD